MRILRLFLLVLFLATTAVFGLNQYRTYKDRDNVAPVIRSDKDELHLSVNSTDKDLLKGVTATDDRDGDVTATLVVAGRSNFIEEGVIKVDYSAFDSHNNVGTYSRRVVYDDYHSPRFHSQKPLAMRLSSSYDFDFFTAEDVLSGDISRKIKVLTNSTGSATTGEYPIELEVTNEYGDVEKLDLILNVYSAAEFNRRYPALSEYIIYVPVGSEPDLSEYLIGIRQGENVMTFEEAKSDPYYVDIDDSLVNYDEPGVYTVDYDLWLSYTLTTHTKMIVIVTEDF